MEHSRSNFCICFHADARGVNLRLANSATGSIFDNYFKRRLGEFLTLVSFFAFCTVLVTVIFTKKVGWRCTGIEIE
jgi:hypothetical protein